MAAASTKTAPGSMSAKAPLVASERPGLAVLLVGQDRMASTVAVAAVTLFGLEGSGTWS